MHPILFGLTFGGLLGCVVGCSFGMWLEKRRSEKRLTQALANILHIRDRRFMQGIGSVPRPRADTPPPPTRLSADDTVELGTLDTDAWHGFPTERSM